MKRRSGVVLTCLLAGLLAGCSSDEVEEYPDADEVPVTEPATGQEGTGQQVDTLLSPVVQPPSGETPP